MALCPQCKDSTLVHTLLNDELAGYSCGKCFGTLVSLVSYRAWRENHARGLQPAPAAIPAGEPQDSIGAIKCPKCSSLMSKYRITAKRGNRIDYCAHCEDIWLDEGEWQLIEQLVNTGELTQVFTQSWQRSVREGVAHSMEEQRYAELLGEDHERVKAFAQWLESHPARNEILARLQRRKR
jgi:Zn-finger nucleic acid-binding protein